MMLARNSGHLFFTWLINWATLIENTSRTVPHGVFAVASRFFKSCGSKDVFISSWKLYCNDNIESSDLKIQKKMPVGIFQNNYIRCTILHILNLSFCKSVYSIPVNKSTIWHVNCVHAFLLLLTASNAK